MASFGMKPIVGTIIPQAPNLAPSPRPRSRSGWNILWLVILLGIGGWGIARAAQSPVSAGLAVTVLSPNGGEA